MFNATVRGGCKYIRYQDEMILVLFFFHLNCLLLIDGTQSANIRTCVKQKTV